MAVETKPWLERMRGLFDRVDAGVCLISAAHRIVYANPRFEQNFGAPDGLRCHQLLRGREVPCEQCQLCGVAEDRSIRWEWVDERRGGRVYDVMDSPVFDDDGERFKLSIFYDITERKKTELALQRARDFYLTLFDEFPTLIWRADASMRCNYFNKAWLNFRGESLEAELRHGWRHSLHPEDQAMVEQAVNGAVARRGSFALECRLMRHDGAYRWIAVESHPFDDLDGGVAHIASCWDITENREALQRTLEGLEMLEKTLSSLQEAVLLVSPGNPRTILDCNASAMRIFGYKRGEMVGKPTSILHVDEDHYRRYGDQAARGFSDKGHSEFFLPMKRKGGEIFPVEHFIRPIYGKEGKVQKHIAVMRDITERQKAEEEHRMMQEQVSQAAKLASLGTLAAGVAHEINNPLMVLQGGLDVLGDIFAQLGVRDDTLSRYISTQASAITRISEIAKGLLTHARRDSEVVTRFDVHSAIRDTLSLVGFIYRKENVRIETEFGPVPLTLKGTIGKFHQVIMNLLVNAKEAIEETERPGVIRIRTERTSDRNGSNVRISISDNGCGIAKENFDKIFGFFYTTKKPGKGTGLGLSITQQIVQSMNGRIEVESEHGVGTTFSVTLPVG